MEIDPVFEFSEGDSLPVFDERDIIASSSEDKSQIHFDSALKDANLSYQARLDAFLGPLHSFNSNQIQNKKGTPNTQRHQQSQQQLKIIPQVNLAQKLLERPPLKQYPIQQQYSERNYYQNNQQDKENWSINMIKPKQERLEQETPLDIINKIRFIKQSIDEVNATIKARLEAIGNSPKVDVNVNQKLAISAQFLGERYQEMMKNFEEYKRKSSSHFYEQQYQSSQNITNTPFTSGNTTNRQVYQNYYSNGAISDRVSQPPIEYASLRDKEPIPSITRSKSFNGNTKGTVDIPLSARQQSICSSRYQSNAIEEQRESPKNSGRNYLQLSQVLNAGSIQQGEQRKLGQAFIKQLPIPKAQNTIMQNWTSDNQQQWKKALNGSLIHHQQNQQQQLGVVDSQNSKNQFSVSGEGRKKSQDKLIKQQQQQSIDNLKPKDNRSHSSYQEKYALLKQHFSTRQGIQLF